MIFPPRWDLKAPQRLDCSEGVSSTKVPAMKRPKPWTLKKLKLNKLGNDDTTIHKATA